MSVHTLTAARLPFADIVAPVAPSGAAQELAWLLVAIPLASAAILLLAGKRSNRWGHWFGVGASVASFVLGAAILVSLLGAPTSERVVELDLFDWISVGQLSLTAGMRLDPLSLTFVLLVTFVGSLIHVYSVAYME